MTPLSQKHYRFLHLTFDLIALSVAWYQTIELRLALNPFMGHQFHRAELIAAAPPLGAILTIWIVAASWLKLYRPRAGLYAGVMESCLVAGTVATVATFFSRSFGTQLSRSFVVLFCPVTLVTMSVGTFATSELTRFLRARWPAKERIAMLGQGRELARLAGRIRRDWVSSYHLVGVVLPEGAPVNGFADGVPVLGTTKQLGQLINRERLNRILVVERSLARSEVEQCARISKRMGVVVSRPIRNTEPGETLELANAPGLCLLDWKPLRFTRKQELLKRVFDVIVAAATLAALAPVLALFAVLVKLSSSGPILYRAPRVGMGGRHFMFFKFRSMYHGANRADLQNEQSGHLFKVKSDPRVTPIGRFMRRYSIDEFPQLINVLRGEMSLVGPRPLPADDLDPDGQSRRFKVWSQQRSRVLPGITGLWQVEGRSELNFKQMIDLDLRYIRNWSLALDLRILLRTPRVVLTGRGAY